MATLVAEQMRRAMETGASIWLTAGTARLTGPHADVPTAGAGARSHTESARSHGAASTCGAVAAARRTRSRTACTGTGAANTSMSQERRSVPDGSGPNTPGPIVAAATHGDQASPSRTDSSRRKPAPTSASALNEGTKCTASPRGIQAGDSRTTSAPSRTGIGAGSIGRRHAGGTRVTRTRGSNPEVTRQRSVLTRFRGPWADEAAHGGPLTWYARHFGRASRHAPEHSGAATGRRAGPLADLARRGEQVRRRGLHPH